MAGEKNSRDSMYAFEVRNWAYIYLFTGDKDSAKKAEDAVLRLIEDGAFWNNPQSKGLSRAMGALNVAVAYDLCHEAWSPETRDRVSAQLAALASDDPSAKDRPHGGTDESFCKASCRQE